MECERNGITVNGKKANGKIMNNVVVGQRDSWWANNGIQIGFKATGTIKEFVTYKTSYK